MLSQNDCSYQIVDLTILASQLIFITKMYFHAGSYTTGKRSVCEY